MDLKPVLGPVQLVFYSVGVIVGAGVYSVLGAAAGLAQHDLWISFLVSAGVALLTAISYAEMATSFRAAGAEYVYIRRAWPKADCLAFGVGAIILIGGAATAATVAMAFGGYLRVLVDCPAPVAAVLLLAGCTALNIWGLRESSWVNVLFTSIEVVGLLLVIFAALASEVQAPAAAMAAEFRENGLPRAIRTDNGVPFASTNALFNLSKLSVWWLRLGIAIERIKPGNPQQNGRHERMHLTLKLETTKPAGANFLQQQARFDDFIDEYNTERPHQALAMKPPAVVHTPSPRPYQGPAGPRLSPPRQERDRHHLRAHLLQHQKDQSEPGFLRPAGRHQAG